MRTLNLTFSILNFLGLGVVGLFIYLTNKSLRERVNTLNEVVKKQKNTIRESAKENGNNSVVDKNVIYQEMYNEKRRFRDYEMVVCGWYGTILLLTIGSLFTLTKTGDTSGLSTILKYPLIPKSIIAFCLFIITILTDISQKHLLSLI